MWSTQGDVTKILEVSDVAAVAIDRVASRMVTAGDGGVTIHDAQGARQPVRITDETVNAIAINDDATRVATAGDNGVVLWDVDGDAPPVYVTSRRVKSVSFSDDGSLIVTIGDDGVQVWPVLDHDAMSDELARRLGDRSFTAAECALYAIDPCLTSG